MALDKRSQVSLIFGTYNNHGLIRFNISRKHSDFGLYSYRKTFQDSPHINVLGNVTGHKIGQGKTRIVTGADLVLLGPASLMLHTKSQGHWPFGSREEDIKGFIIYDRGSHLGHVTRAICITIG